MKATIHKLLAGAFLGVLTVFGLTVLSSSTYYEDAPVWGFTDTECQSQDYKWFRNVGALIAADGQKDPDATGDDKDKIWYWRSYIEDGDDSYTCHLVEYEEVVARGTIPKKQTPPHGGGGGGGSGSVTPTPAPQAPIPQKSQAQKQADNFTKDELDDIRECVEEKLAGVTKEIKGWNSDAIGATEAVWELTKGVDYALGETTPFLNEDSTLSLYVQIYPHGIANKIAATAHRDTFKHTTAYTEMHELFHVGQIKAIFDATGALPKPYEWWGLEVEAHKGSAKLWQKLYDKKEDAGVPSILLSTAAEKNATYQKNEDRYKVLEARRELGSLTDADAAEMESLATWLKNPENLPQATANNYYEPGKLKNFECD